MICSTELCSFILVWMTLTLLQGQQRHKGQHERCIFLLDSDPIELKLCVAVTCFDKIMQKVLFVTLREIVDGPLSVCEVCVCEVCVCGVVCVWYMYVVWVCVCVVWVYMCVYCCCLFVCLLCLQCLRLVVKFMVTIGCFLFMFWSSECKPAEHLLFLLCSWYVYVFCSIMPLKNKQTNKQRKTCNLTGVAEQQEIWPFSSGYVQIVVYSFNMLIMGEKMSFVVDWAQNTN